MEYFKNKNVTTIIKAKLKNSGGQTNIDKYIQGGCTSKKKKYVIKSHKQNTLFGHNYVSRLRIKRCFALR